jgi:tetratricopeptide (TPR) repeat protein
MAFVAQITNVVANELSGLSPYAYSPENYNTIGYKLLKAKKAEEAFKIFKLSASASPDSWAVYHGLGESYRMLGQKELALSNFKKSLELNPNNVDTLRAITRLTNK